MQEYIYLEDGVVALNVKEQRLSNLIQGLLVAACLGASPAVKRIPKSVLWGYFAYMSLESLPGSEFWDRILLTFTDKRRRYDPVGIHEDMTSILLCYRHIQQEKFVYALQYALCCVPWRPHALASFVPRYYLSGYAPNGTDRVAVPPAATYSSNQCHASCFLVWYSD